MMKKIIGILICMLLVSVIFAPMGIAYVDVTKPQNTGSGKPDLIIDNIIIRTGSFPGDQIFYCKVKNIGDAKTEGDIEIQTTVKLMFFRIPLIKVFSELVLFGIGGHLYPGESVELSIVTDDDLPKFGFYQFSCTVNPNQVIDESAYSNNHYSESFRVFFGRWF